MKVKQLMKVLADLPPNAEVILQKDSEGNGYSPLSDVDGDGVYVKETNYSGTVYSSEWSADEAGLDEDEWKKLLKKPRCVVLFPIN